MLLSITGREKNLLRFFVLFFLISFVIINWNEISWVFNYRAVSRRLPSLFKEEELKEIETKEIEYFEKEDSIEIPKIGITAPIVFIENNCEENNCEKEYEKALKKGVLHYPQSSFLEKGETTIILGHSAPLNWPKIDYDWVFNDLSKLDSGDEIYVYFEKQKYVYIIKEKLFLGAGEDIPPQNLTESESMLILLSCWPPGKDYERIAVKAILSE